ncbi:MAG: hypothetical protein JO256_13585 [Alphaproteobacteria bacterium]|nr:hypothetical protein [Alphaproteobacteria bacterium]
MAKSLFSLKISCPHCRQAGFVAWEGVDGTISEPTPPRLVFLSRGFHPERRTSGLELPIIVCDVCDEIQEGITGGQLH